MNITKLSPVFGAEIDGIDLSTIGDGDFEEVYRAWVEYGVLRFRGQKLDDAQLEAFSSRFGPLEKIPLRLTPEQEKRIPSLYVVALSNITIDGKPIGGLGNSEANWHSDMTYEETPPPASVLLSVEIPAEGGDTQFCCQHAAAKAAAVGGGPRISEFRSPSPVDRTGRRHGAVPVDQQGVRRQQTLGRIEVGCSTPAADALDCRTYAGLLGRRGAGAGKHQQFVPAGNDDEVCDTHRTGQ